MGMGTQGGRCGDRGHRGEEGRGTWERERRHGDREEDMGMGTQGWVAVRMGTWGGRCGDMRAQEQGGEGDMGTGRGTWEQGGGHGDRDRDTGTGEEQGHRDEDVGMGTGQGVRTGIGWPRCHRHPFSAVGGPGLTLSPVPGLVAPAVALDQPRWQRDPVGDK